MDLFTNQQIDIDELPRMRNVDYIKPQKSYLALTVSKSIVFWLFLSGMFMLSIFAANQEFPHLTPYAKWVFFPFAILSIILTWISYYKRGHALRAYDIIYKEGVLYNNITTISFNRVQHCEISQGPLDQLFDLYTLKVFTAGGQSSDLEVPGLDKETANGLKEYIVDATAQKVSKDEQENDSNADSLDASDQAIDALPYSYLNLSSEEE